MYTDTVMLEDKNMLYENNCQVFNAKLNNAKLYVFKQKEWLNERGRGNY